MKTITKRQLNQQTAQVLAEVQAGEPVLVTERGVARWRIEAVDSIPDPVARMLAQGRITPPSKNPAPWPTDRDAHGRSPEEVDALLADMRGDR